MGISHRIHSAECQSVYSDTLVIIKLIKISPREPPDRLRG